MVMLQIMAWELLTHTKFYGADADMNSVVDALLGSTALPTELHLPPAVQEGLGNRTFKDTTLAMLHRDPSQRPSMDQLVKRWSAMAKHNF